MQVNSPIVGQLQASLGQAVGGGIEVPDALIPVIRLPAPLGAHLPNSASDVDLRNSPQSAGFTFVINQGALSALVASPLIILDRGVYRVYGQIMSVVLSGPAPSSASMKCARVTLFDPDFQTATDIAATPLFVGTPQLTRFDTTLHLSRQGYSIDLETLVATGAGQSIGAEAVIMCQRLV